MNTYRVELGGRGGDRRTVVIRVYGELFKKGKVNEAESVASAAHRVKNNRSVDALIAHLVSKQF